MAVIVPYPRLSLSQSETASQLITKKSEIIQTFFPLAAYDDYNEPKVATFLITTSSGSKTLILADALAFVNLRNSCDPLRELLPVIFDCRLRNCSVELIQAIRDDGQTIGGSPRLVALQIESDDRSTLFKLFSPSYTEDNPHLLLASIIREDVQEGYIGDYRIKKIPDGWIPPARNPA